MKRFSAALLPLMLPAVLLPACRTCYDARFYSDMIGHSTEEIVGWLGLPAEVQCRYGVDEYTWYADEPFHSTEGMEAPVRIFRDEEGLRHVHYFTPVSAEKKDHAKHARLTVRFYNAQAVGFYTENAEGLCNRFVPEYLQEAYAHHDKNGHPHLRSQDNDD